MLKNKKTIDSLKPKNSRDRYFDYPLALFVNKHKKSSLVFSKYGKLFYTGNSDFNLYSDKRFDSLYKNLKPVSVNYSGQFNDLYQKIKDRYSDQKNYWLDLISGYTQGVSPVKMWNISIISALIFGMFLMTFIYRYLGQGVSATSSQANPPISAQTELIGEVGAVLGAQNSEEDKKGMEEEEETHVAEIVEKYQKESSNEKALKDFIQEMVEGYPIESMTPFIAKKDPTVAAFLVSIAKKESNWGKRAPVLNGKDCHNYWGYKGLRKKMGTGGHTCFNSPQDAVDTVAKRLEFLIHEEKVNTPKEMVVVWKCGYDCSWDSPKAVKKWVSDVESYFKEFKKFF